MPRRWELRLPMVSRAAGFMTQLWELEEYLSESREKINGKYDYRYSTLPIVFGQLLREGRISIDELRGLGDDKVAYIRLVAGFGEKEARV
jgi:Photoprotection regulator fluorescence recovery protein